MLIKVISDTHGYLPTDIGEFDLLLIGGDVCPAHDHYYGYQKGWLVNEFAEWINSLQFKDQDSRVVMIPGNHDFAFDNFEYFKDELSEATNERLEVLINEEYSFYGTDKDGNKKTLSIFGTPYCKIFFNWAFMLPNEDLKEKYDEIPYGVDVLLTHDAPDLNGLGVISEGYTKGVNAGSKVLADAVIEKRPRYVFCGHIHSGNHNFCEYEGIKMANVSYVNERYQPVNKPLEIEI